jgi:dynein light intermediate chain 1
MIEVLTDSCAGGSTESQREFLEALSGEDGRKAQDRQSSKQPPIANSFALGYTYHDVLDADHEGTPVGILSYLRLH